MSDDEYFDDGDRGGPTSHRYLYEMDREELFAVFVTAVGPLTVDDGGCHCIPAEAMGLARMARAVQNRADTSIPREDALWTLARVTRVLLSATDDHDNGTRPYWHMPLPEVVGHFLRVRAEVGDFIPAATVAVVPDDPYGVESAATVVRDADGRLWTELDPGDEVLSFDDPRVQEMAESDPALAAMIAEERTDPWPWP